jgi:hypothetical protein
MELEQRIAREIIGSLSGNRKGKASREVQEREVSILKSLHDSFEERNKQGSLHLYIELKGWTHIYHVFGGYAGFLSAMKEAGYQKGFRSKKKREWQELFNPEKSE